ncbi:hypothetical protein BLA39750_06763 [Burkholderia lata]|uniref:Uncharacterized protein n=1 Tax=Burkholderia lata (strain ATCC 17760 / DSM 23089 / LMG 22485 / NCIMB 9086 / R18194 / 383) TaxID=482957 RepID=A0A6P3BMP7_BURL3|nr:hypothetical protein [Burkholderia lata]VWD56269.1 hypothetical protein BLA39750_06763 [Burkholderia lata]
MTTDHRDAEPPSTRVDEIVSEHAGPPAVTPRFPAVLLWVAGIPLWGLLAAAVICVSRIGDLSVIVFIGALIFLSEVGIAVYAVVAVVLLAYAVSRKPWRAPRLAWAFWLQVLLWVLAVALIATFKIDDYQRHHPDPREAARGQQINDDNARMTDALRTDDAVAFRQAFADCADDCDRATWVSEAVRKTAPRSLAVTLEGVRHASEVRLGGDDPQTFCKDGVAYVMPPDIALRVGFRNVPAITAQFLPLWGPDERSAALHGAVMSGSIALMNQLVALGVDPRHLQGDSRFQSLYASAAAGAAIASVGWLANAGVTLHTAEEVDEVWYRFAKWTYANPPEIARKGAEAWLVAFAKIPMDAAAAQNRIAPLERAVYVETPVLVQVLLQHGYRVADLAPEYRAHFDVMQDLVRHSLTSVPDTGCDDDAN